jgi:sugar lactone lactonase YvrE
MMSKEISVHAHNPKMNQPNDLAIAPDGTLYASDPNWGNNTGQLWRIDRDGKTLYVNESLQRRVWAYALTPQRTLGEKRLLITFPDHAMDGMRCDVDGNLHITRHGKGTVVVLSPAGKVLREIAVPGTMPSNLCFGGPDGRTVYVTEQQKGRLLSFRADRPGLEWQRWRERR